MKEIFSFEYKRIISKAWFLISCFLLPVSTIVVILLTTLLGRTIQAPTILIGGTSILAVTTLEELKSQPQLVIQRWNIKHIFDKKGAIKLVKQKKAKVYLEIENDQAVLYTEKKDNAINQIIGDVFKNVYTNLKLIEKGFDPAEIKQLKNGARINFKFVGLKNKAQEMGFLAFILNSLLYLSLIVFGDLLARKVIEDKESNFIEVLLLYKKPLQIFLGKYLATFASYLTLLTIAFGSTYIILISIKGNFLYILIKNTISNQFMAEISVIFFAAYLLYSALFVLSGTLSNTEDNLKKFNIFIYIILIVSTVTEYTLRYLPPTSLGKILIYFPFTAPFFFLTKIIQGDINNMQLLIAIVLMSISSLLILQFAANRFKINLINRKKLYKKK